MSAIAMVLVRNAAHVQHQKMALQSVQVVNVDIHAAVAIPIMAKSAVKISLMPRLQIMAARHAALNVTMAITNQMAAVCLMLVQTVQHNAREEYRRRVPAAYGLAAQSVQRIRFVAEAAVQLVLLVSMSIRIPAKTIA